MNRNVTWSRGIIDRCSSSAVSHNHTWSNNTPGVAYSALHYWSFKRKTSRLDKLFNPIEKFIYKITGVNTEQTMGWKQYFLAGLLLNVVMMVIGFLILVFQGNLPLNPMGFPGLHPDLAFMQVVSFTTTQICSIIMEKQLFQS